MDPYQVIERINKIIYKIRFLDNMDIVLIQVHVSKLKVLPQREENRLATPTLSEVCQTSMPSTLVQDALNANQDNIQNKNFNSSISSQFKKFQTLAILVLCLT